MNALHQRPFWFIHFGDFLDYLREVFLIFRCHFVSFPQPMLYIGG